MAEHGKKSSHQVHNQYFIDLHCALDLLPTALVTARLTGRQCLSPVKFLLTNSLRWAGLKNAYVALPMSSTVHHGHDKRDCGSPAHPNCQVLDHSS